MFARGRGNIAHQRGNLGGALADVREDALGTRDDFGAVLHFLHSAFNERRGVSGGFRGPHGEVAHFVRHHGKAGTDFAGLRGFDGRVQGEQFRLEGNFVDGLDDLGCRFAGLGNFRHGRHELLHGFVVLLHHHIGFPGKGVRLLGVVGVLPRHGGHFFEGGSSFLERSRLLASIGSQGMAGR